MHLLNITTRNDLKLAPQVIFCIGILQSNKGLNIYLYFDKIKICNKMKWSNKVDGF